MARGSEKDFWDKLDVFAKLFVGLVISGGIGFYTFHVSERNRTVQAELERENRAEQTRIQTENRKAETLIQLLNARESAATALRTNMFKVMLEHFLKEKDYDSQVVMLEMIGLNFRDSIQIKPMFEKLDRELKEQRDNRENKSRVLLRKAAQSIVRDQLEQIQRSKLGSYCEISLQKNYPERPTCFQDLQVELTGVEEDRVRVRTNTKDRRFVGSDDRDTDEFSVTYYDMPIADYTHVVLGNDTLRYSVALLESKPPGGAEVVVSRLPTADFNADDRYGFDEAVSEILNFQPDGQGELTEGDPDTGASSAAGGSLMITDTEPAETGQ